MEILGSFRSFRKGAGVNLWHETCQFYTTGTCAALAEPHIYASINIHSQKNNKMWRDGIKERKKKRFPIYELFSQYIEKTRTSSLIAL